MKIDKEDMEAIDALVAMADNTDFHAAVEEGIKEQGAKAAADGMCVLIQHIVDLRKTIETARARVAVAINVIEKMQGGTQDAMKALY